MFEFLPKEVREGLDAARKRDAKARSRLCVHIGGEVFHVLRLWHDGFALDAAGTPRMRGLVDLYDGPRHLSECLIVASVEENGEMICDIKRRTPASDRPALDFYQAEGEAPVALLSSVR
ncbi:MAG: hypothetical protein H5U19_12225 [Rhodobacteraceae bacterium]|jgi:hypothetical protein|nr:hypothetical protein [Paracoccaceae bacterium]